MRNIFLNRQSSKLGLLGSLVAVVAVAFVLALVPQKTNIKTLAENCVNPPTTPTLNYWPITYDDVNTPLCHDFPAIDAAVYNPNGTPAYSTSEADWNNGLTLSSGQEGVALMYIHNGAANNLPSNQTLARNVKITTTTDTSVGGTHNIAVRFAGDNTNTVNKSFAIHTPTNAKLEIVPNSGFMYDYQGHVVLDQQHLNLGNSTYTLGDLDACFEYSVFLSFRFKVVTPPPVEQNTNLSITKGVRAFNPSLDSVTYPYAPSITSNQNDRVQYKVIVTNTGSTTARAVTMTDPSVSGIAVEAGSTTVGTADDALITPGLWQGAVPGTINLGDLAPGEHRIIKYNGKVTASSGTLTNTAKAQASNASMVQAQATVTVRTITVSNPKLTISKLVKNISTSTAYSDSVQSRTGERVGFKVDVTNSGDTTLNNVQMNDVIPNGLTFESTTSDSVTSKFINPNFSVSLGTMTPGQTKSIEFTTQVLALAPTTICNVAKATATGVSEVQDNACVTVYTTPKSGSPNIVLSKAAFNNTKNVNATTVNADRGNTITFTLTTTNTGDADAVNYVISDDLSGVLPLADLIDNAGATLNGNILSYPAMTIKPGETVTKTFKVYVKTSLAPSLSYQIRNTYGNTVVINIPGNVVYQAPHTGTAGTSAAVFAGLITAAAVVVRRGKDILGFIFA